MRSWLLHWFFNKTKVLSGVPSHPQPRYKCQFDLTISERVTQNTKHKTQTHFGRPNQLSSTQHGNVRGARHQLPVPPGGGQDLPRGPRLRPVLDLEPLPDEPLGPGQERPALLRPVPPRVVPTRFLAGGAPQSRRGAVHLPRAQPAVGLPQRQADHVAPPSLLRPRLLAAQEGSAGGLEPQRGRLADACLRHRNDLAQRHGALDPGDQPRPVRGGASVVLRGDHRPPAGPPADAPGAAAARLLPGIRLLCAERLRGGAGRARRALAANHLRRTAVCCLPSAVRFPLAAERRTSSLSKGAGPP